MKTKIHIAFIGLLVATAFYNFNIVNSRSIGSPGGYTGSPGDGRSCGSGGCHGGGHTFQAGMIKSTIPTTGYIPNSTYTISAKVAHPVFNKFGFELSPQNLLGNGMGTLISTSATQLVNSNKAITHTSSSMAGQNKEKTWSFTWIAPAIGSGDVTFYAAFNAANGSGSGGDDIYVSTQVVPEGTLAGVEDETVKQQLSFFPNPATDWVTITGNVLFSNLQVVDLAGRVVVSARSDGSTPSQLDVSQLPSGTYLVVAETPSGRIVEKLIVSR